MAIFIPAYNNDEAVIFSLVNSSKHNNVEYIVFDSANSASLKKFCGTNNLLYVKNVNCGRVNNWNACVNFAREKEFPFFKFLFAGDVLEKNSLKLYLDNFSKYNSVNLITGAYEIVNENGSRRKVNHLNDNCIITDEEVDSFNQRYENWFGPPSSQAYRTKGISNCKFSEVQPWTADWLFSLQIANRGETLFLQETLCSFHIIYRKTYYTQMNSLSSKIEELNIIRMYNGEEKCLLESISRKLSLIQLLKILWAKLKRKIM